MAGTPKVLRVALERVIAGASGPAAEPEMLSSSAARHIKRVASLFDDKNIVGAGVASKISDGKDLSELSLVFYVRKKLPRARLNPDHMVPPVVEGGNRRAVFTDVVEIGNVVPQLNIGKPPLRSGFSIGDQAGSTGTLGALVHKRKKVFALSNAHVLADSGRGSAGDIVLYPGKMDGGKKPGSVIGRLDSFTSFKADSGFTNKTDAALAEILEAFVDKAELKLWKAKSPLKVATPQRGMRVVKRGRTSGDTESVVRDVDFNITVDYPGVGKVGFTGQVLCDTYTQAGDSGSIVVDKKSGAVVGLHFAGSSSGSIFTPIRAVMAALHFKF
jgi:hypothetical protein